MPCRLVESQVHAADTLYEVHRLLSSSSDQVRGQSPQNAGRNLEICHSYM